MDIKLATNIGGYFSYKIYRDTPNNIIYQSSQQKNLIVDSGLKHLYSFSIPEVMRVLDIGNSNEPAMPGDTKLKGASFNNSNIFNDLLALYITGGPIEEESASEYTAFFRTKTTSSPTLLKEFVIKPGVGLDAFARQIFDTITLQGGDGIEFTYKVRVNWPCAPVSSTMKLSYYKGVEGGTDIYSNDQLPLVWSPVSSLIDSKLWSSIYSGNNVTVAVASASTPGDEDVSNIIYSNNNGVTWLSATTPEDVLYDLNQPLNDVTYGFIANDAGGFTNRYVAVGLKDVFYSETGSLWLSATPAQRNNWTGIAFGKPSRTVPVGSITLPYTPLFVAVANTGANRLMTSSDVATWTVVDSAVTNTPNWSSITYGGEKFAAVADGGSHRIAYSTDGETWLSAAAPALNEWQDIAYGNGLFVAVSKNATYSPIMYASGGDLSKWYPARSPYPASWRGIAYGDGLFVAVGEADFQPRAIYSQDGKNWSPVASIPFDKVWESVSFINNTFVAIASSNTTMEYPLARVESSPRSASITNIDLTTALLNIPDRVFNPDYILYTLRDFNMPTSCESSLIDASDIQYSTTHSFNSYAKAQSSLLSPNTAISTFSFSKTTGHGAIKNFLITDSPITSAGTLSGIWVSELNVDSGDLSESVVYTGTESSIITLSPRSGSLTRNLSSTIGDITNSTFKINIIHTWLPGADDQSGSETSDNRTTSTNGTTDRDPTGDPGQDSTGDQRPYVDIIIPFWEVIDLNDYIAGEYYASYIDSSDTIALYSSLLSYPYSIETCNPSTGLSVDNPDLRIYNNVTLNAETTLEDSRNPSLNKNRVSQSGVGSNGLLKTSSEIKAYINTTTINPASGDIISFINGSKVTGQTIKQQFDDYCNMIGIDPIVDQIVLTKERGEIATNNPFVRGTNNAAAGAKVRIYFKNDPQIIKPDFVRSIASVPDEFLCSSVNGDQNGVTEGTIHKEFYVITP